MNNNPFKANGEPTLLEDESIVWQGAPSRRLTVTANDGKALLRALPFCVWAAAFPAGLSLAFKVSLWLIPIVILLCTLIVFCLNLCKKMNYRQHTSFILTNKRLIALTSPPNAVAYLVELPLNAIANVRVVKSKNGVGHICVGLDNLPEYFMDTGLFRPFDISYATAGKWERHRRLQSFGWRSVYKYYDDPARYMTLFAVPDAAAVAELIMKTKQSLVGEKH